MTEPKWTPGPWQVHKRQDEDEPTLVLSEECNVAECSSFNMGTPIGQDAANAHLIAAAPELYEALERCLNFIANTESEMGETLGSGDKARAALAKARGEQ